VVGPTTNTLILWYTNCLKNITHFSILTGTTSWGAINHWIQFDNQLTFDFGWIAYNNHIVLCGATCFFSFLQIFGGRMMQPQPEPWHCDTSQVYAGLLQAFDQALDKKHPTMLVSELSRQQAIWELINHMAILPPSNTQNTVEYPSFNQYGWWATILNHIVQEVQLYCREFMGCHRHGSCPKIGISHAAVYKILKEASCEIIES